MPAYSFECLILMMSFTFIVSLSAIVFLLYSTIYLLWFYRVSYSDNGQDELSLLVFLLLYLGLGMWVLTLCVFLHVYCPVMFACHVSSYHCLSLFSLFFFLFMRRFYTFFFFLHTSVNSPSIPSSLTGSSFTIFLLHFVSSTCILFS